MKVRFFVVACLLSIVFASGCRSASSQYTCRARQSEAKGSLTALHKAQAAYLASNKKYAASVTDLGFTVADARYYDVKIESASATTYTATATGKQQAEGDVWTVDHAGTPVAKVDKCLAGK